MVLRSLAALTVPLVFLVSCTADDPEPILAPSASPTPTSEGPSPTASASEEPESPEDFIRRWVDLNTQLQNTGTSSEFLAASAKKCQPCRDFAELVTSYYDAGGFVRTQGIQVISIRAVNPGTTKDANFIVNARSAPTEYKETASAELQSLSGGPSDYRFVLTLGETGWLVNDYIQRAS